MALTIKHTTIKFRDYKHLDEDKLLEDMKNIDWESIKQMIDANEMWTFFKNSLIKVFDNHLPYKERRINARSEQWINDDILTEMRHRDYLHIQALKTNSENDWALYKYSRNTVVSKIREVKKIFIDEVTDQVSMKPKDMWTRLNQFIPSKSKNCNTSYLEVDEQTITQNSDIANAFNNFFCSIGHNLGIHFDNSLPDMEQLMPNDSFSIPKLTENFVKRKYL